MPQTDMRRQIDAPCRPGTRLGWGRTVGKRAGGKAPKIVKIVVDQERNAHDYVLASLGGRSTSGALTTETNLTYTSDADGTKPEIRDGLIGKVEANANALRRVNPYGDASSDSILYLEGRQPGDDFTFSETDDDLTATVIQAASDDEAIPFGAGVCRGDGDDVCLPSLTTTEAVEAAAGVKHATPASPNASDTIHFIVTEDFDGDGVPTAHDVPVVPNAAGVAQTVDNIVTAFTGKIAGLTVTDGTTHAIFTGPATGLEFEITTNVEGGNGTTCVMSDETDPVVAQAAVYALSKPFAGLAGAAAVEQTPAGSGPLEHDGGASLPVETYGPVAAWVEPGITPATTENVYLRCVTSGTKKRAMLTNAHVVGETVLIPELKWSVEGQTGDWSPTERTAPCFVDVK